MPFSARLLTTATATYLVVLVLLLFQFGQPRLELRELRARARQHYGLHVALLAAHHIQLAEHRRDAGPEILFDVLGGGLLHDLAQLAYQIVDDCMVVDFLIRFHTASMTLSV